MSLVDVVSTTSKPPGSLPTVGGVTLAGGVSPTGAAPTAKSGDVYTSTVPTGPGGLDASWTGAAGTILKAGDLLFYDGAKWYVIASKKDLDDFLSLSGGNMKPNAQINLNDGVLLNAHLDNGRF